MDYTIFQQLEDCLKNAEKLYTDMHEAKTKFENLDQMTKQVIAQAEIDAMDSFLGQRVSQTEIQRKALASELFKTHLEGLKVARDLYNKALAKTKALEIKTEILRSLNKYQQ